MVCSGLCRSLLFSSGNKEVAILIVPGGDAMSPPDLTRDAPVLYVAHPVEVGALPVIRYETNPPIFDSANGRCSERGGPHEPLICQVRLHHSIRAVAAGDHHSMFVYFLNQALCL